MNATMKKFGYPETLVKEYTHWVLLLRPQQATLGALVLVCKDESEALSKITLAAFSELKEITTEIEFHLMNCFFFDKINYLLLMMVDKDVHFHVLPRYAQPRLLDGNHFTDPGWPGPPDLNHNNKTGLDQNKSILSALLQKFSG